MKREPQLSTTQKCRFMGKDVRENSAFCCTSARVSPLPPARLTHFLTQNSTPLSTGWVAGYTDFDLMQLREQQEADVPCVYLTPGTYAYSDMKYRASQKGGP